jgi:CheY-like chemotaxis protein
MATVLCIDDNRNILEINKALLESNGYRVLIAPDGPTGIAVTRTHSIDAVVLDFNMPGMDGTQVAEVLMKEQPKLPVVILSGCVDEIPESLKWFADALLHKGDGPIILLSALEKLVNACNTSKKVPAPTTINAREQLSA